MALKSKSDNRYLKVTGVTIQTVPAVTGAEMEIDNHSASLAVTVNFNIYKNQDARLTPDEWTLPKPDSRGFGWLPEVEADGQWVPPPYDKVITMGYLLLKSLEEFAAVNWEDC